MGIDTAKAFLVGLLGLVIIGVVALILLNALGDSTSLTKTVTVSTTNEAHTGGLNATGFPVTNYGATGFGSFVVDGLKNGTKVWNSGNYTTNTSGWIFNNTVPGITGTVTVNYTYSWTPDNEVAHTIDNSTAAVDSFFSNTGTWLALLAIVVLILIIVVVIVVVNRFGGAGGGERDTY